MFYSIEMLKLWHKTASSKKEVCKLFLPFSQGKKGLEKVKGKKKTNINQQRKLMETR